MNETRHFRSNEQPDHFIASAEVLEHFAKRWREGVNPQEDAPLLALIVRIIARKT